MQKLCFRITQTKVGLLFAILLVALSVSVAFSWEKPLRVVLDWDYPPFTYIDEKGSLVGISVDFWKSFTEKTGIQVALVPMEWNMAHKVMLQKEAEVIDTIFYTPERDNYLDYTKPLFPITSSVYYRKNLSISSLQDLTPYLVGVKEKDALFDIARSKNPSISFQFYKNYKDIVRAAKRGEIQVFLMDDPPANYYLVREELLYEFSRIPLPILNHLYLATWEGNGEILNLLQKGIDKFTPQELQALYQRYIPQTEGYPPWLWKVIFIVIISFVLFFAVLSLYNYSLRKKVTLVTQELVHKNQVISKAEKKLHHTIEVTSALSFFILEEKEFFSKMLDLALEIIPKAQHGSVILVNEQGGAEIVATRGHDQRLVGFTFQKEDLLVTEKTQVCKDILDPHRKFSSPENYQRLLTLSQPIAETLIAPLRWREEFFGYLALDIPRESKEHFTETDIKLLESLVSTSTAFRALKEYTKNEELFMEKIITILIKSLEYHDQPTKGHSETAAFYILKMAEKLHLDPKRTKRLYWATFIHDVGKIFIPQEILTKPGSLTQEEYALVKLHSTKSEELILGVKGLEDIAKIIRHHHERWDGTGYPDGLRGEEIPPESRLIAIVDAFEAMTSARPYKRALNIDEAIEELKRHRGTQFDPLLVDILIDVLAEELQKTQQ